MNHMRTDRLLELLADEALAALNAERRAELEMLLADCPPAQRDALIQTAAITTLAFVHSDRSALQAMPERLKGRLLSAAEAQRLRAKPG